MCVLHISHQVADKSGHRRAERRGTTDNSHQQSNEREQTAPEIHPRCSRSIYISIHQHVCATSAMADRSDTGMLDTALPDSLNRHHKRD